MFKALTSFFLFCIIPFSLIATDSVSTETSQVNSKNKKQVAMVIALRGSAIIQRKAGEKEPAKIKSSLFNGDLIQTNFGSQAQIVFIDGSKVNLVGSSDLTIERYSFEKGQKPVSELKIDNGALSFMAGKISKVAPENYKVKTALATIGIRGSSGEIETSNGQLPGIPKSLNLMKSGGIGLVVSSENNPNPIEISQSGMGLSFSQEGLPETKAFSGSIVKNFTQKKEKKFSEAKKTSEPSNNSATQQKNSSSSLASHSQKKQGKNPNQGSKQNSVGGSSQGAQKENRQLVKTSSKQNLAPRNLVKENLNLQNKPQLSNALTTAGAIQTDLVQNQLQNSLDQKQEKSLREKRTQIIQNSLNNNTTNQNSIALTSIEGFLHRLKYESLTLSQYLEDLNFSLNPTTQTLSSNQNQEPFSLPLFNNQTDLAYYSNTSDTTLFYPNMDFVLFNQFQQSQNQLLVGFYGKKTAPENLPLSGIHYYSSEIPGEEESRWVKSSLLIENQKIVNPGFQTHAAIDFTTKKAVAITTDPNKNRHSLDTLRPEENVTIPDTFFYSTIDTNGEMDNGTLMANLGFMPSHVQLPNSMSPGSVSYTLHTTDLSQYSGSSYFYGETGSGIGIKYSKDSNHTFTAAGFKTTHDQTLTNISQSYSGFLQGMQVLEDGSNISLAKGSLTLNPNFSINSLSGNLTLEGNPLTIGSKNIAITREILFGDLIEVDNSSPQLVDNRSFLSALDLPKFTLSDGSEQVFENILWGTWNIVEAGATKTIYPGKHNYWIAGVANINDESQSTVAEKLGFNEDTIHNFRGAILQTTVDQRQDVLKQERMLISDSWSISQFGEQTVDKKKPLLPAVGGTSPFVSSEIASLEFNTNFDDNNLYGIAYLREQRMVLIFRGDNDSINSSGFTGDTYLLSLSGRTDDFDLFHNGDKKGDFSGHFINTPADSLIFEFDRTKNHDGLSDYTFGVGAAMHQREITDQDHNYTAYLHGVWFPYSGMPVLLANPNIRAEFESDVEDGCVSGDIFVNNDMDDEWKIRDEDVNIFLHKDAFFFRIDPDDNIALSPNLGVSGFDRDDTNMLALPGLENYAYINWGVWNSRNDGKTGIVHGYFGGGNVDTAIPDASAIAASANPVVDFHGVTQGSFFGASGSEFKLGDAALSINFSTAAMEGELKFDNDQTVIELQGSYSSGSFNGTAAFANDNSSSGSFRGGSYHDEISGAFGVEGATQKATGAFGAKADRTIPVTARP